MRGEAKSGNLTVKKNGDTLTLAACPKKPPTPPATYKLVLNNKTGQAVTVTLTGPATYTFTLQPGKTSQDVEAGQVPLQLPGVPGRRRRARWR